MAQLTKSQKETLRQLAKAIESTVSMSNADFERAFGIQKRSSS